MENTTGTSRLNQAWAGFYQQLGRSFTDTMEWPIASKVSLLTVVILIYHVFCYLFWESVFSSEDTRINYQLWRDFQRYWILGIVISLCIIELLRRNNYQGLWPYIISSCSYVGFIVFHMYCLGSLSSYPAAHLGCSLVVILVFLGGRIALASALFALVLVGAIVFAEVSGALPYAPVFLDAKNDLYTTPAFASTIFLSLVIVIFQGLIITVLVLAALRNSEFKSAQANTIIRRYVPRAVVDDVMAGKQADIDTPKRRRITVLVAEIVGFTDIADRVEPEVITQVLNEYLSAMNDLIENHDGSVNEVAGDGLMALFGAPNTLETEAQALQAVRAGLSMQAEIPTLNAMWRKLGLGQKLQIRIGINTGVLSVGSFGSAGRRTYTAIGLQTNITDRIQSHCEPGEILMSEASWQLIKDSIVCEEAGSIEMEGVHFPISIYKPVMPGA